MTELLMDAHHDVINDGLQAEYDLAFTNIVSGIGSVAVENATDPSVFSDAAIEAQVAQFNADMAFMEGDVANISDIDRNFLENAGITARGLNEKEQRSYDQARQRAEAHFRQQSDAFFVHDIFGLDKLDKDDAAEDKKATSKPRSE
jgi:hypothetical protein